MSRNSPVTLAGPKQVEVRALDREFESLWKSLAPQNEEATAMQANTANLVAAVSSRAEAEAAADVIGEIIGRSPCRGLLLVFLPEAHASRLEVEISVIGEKPPFGEKQVCCEMIRLAASGASAQTLPTLVESLYVPDLPIVVWWPGSPPLTHESFRRLAKSADRVVIDSESFGRGGMRELAEFIEHSRKLRTAVSDLNWARLTPYRQLLAQFFDTAHGRERLEKIESVAIEAHEAAGLLMAGWLISRLGRGYRHSPREAREPLLLEAVNLKVTTGKAVFQSITMSCSGGEFSVRRADEEMVEARSRIGSEATSRAARIPLAPVAKWLSEEIGYSGRDRAFDAAVKSAASL